MAVPKFGGWDSTELPADYSMKFATARENKKQSIKTVAVPKIHAQDDCNNLPHSRPSYDEHHHVNLRPPPHQHNSPKREWLTRYFSCCVGIGAS